FLDVVHSYHVRPPDDPPVYAEDYLWASPGGASMEALAATLPPVVTYGSTVVERGRAHFMGPPLVECPRCGGQMQRRQVALSFKHAPEASRSQEVEAWVCSCGERYVPGPAARAAYLRAFGRAGSPPRATLADLYREEGKAELIGGRIVRFM